MEIMYFMYIYGVYRHTYTPKTRSYAYIEKVVVPRVTAKMNEY